MAKRSLTSLELAQLGGVELEPGAIPDRRTLREQPGVTSDPIRAYLESIAGGFKAEQDPSLTKDIAAGIMASLAAVPTSIGFVAEEFAGIPGAGALREAGQRSVEFFQRQQSEQFRQRVDVPFLEDGEGNFFDRLNLDPVKVLAVVTESLPFMATGMTLGAFITKGLLARAAAKAGAKGLTKAAVTRAGITGAAIGEGGIAAPLNAQSAFDQVMQTPFAKMAETEPFKAAFAETDPDLPMEERLNLAKRATAKTAAAWVGLITGGTTSILGAPSGVWMARVMRGEKGKTLLSTIAKGFVLEGPGQELPQSVVEQITTNVSVNLLADPSRRITQDVPEAAISGVLAGGITGGAVAGAGRGAATALDALQKPALRLEDDPNVIDEDLAEQVDRAIGATDRDVNIGEEAFEPIIPEPAEADIVPQIPLAEAVEAAPLEGLTREQIETRVTELTQQREEQLKQRTKKTADATTQTLIEFLARTTAAGAAAAGINLEEARAQGVDALGSKEQIAEFGRVAFTKQGMSFDAAAEIASEAGFTDPQGNPLDVNSLLEALTQELGEGPPVLTPQGAEFQGQLDQTEAALSEAAQGVEAFEAGRAVLPELEALLGQLVTEGEDFDVQAAFDEENYFALVNADEDLRTLSDLVTLAEELNEDRAVELVERTPNRGELAVALADLIREEQARGEREAEEPGAEAEPAGPEAVAEPGAEAPPVTTTGPGEGRPAEAEPVTEEKPPAQAEAEEEAPPAAVPEAEEAAAEEVPPKEKKPKEPRKEKPVTDSQKAQVTNQLVREFVDLESSRDIIIGHSNDLMAKSIDAAPQAYRSIYESYVAPRLNELWDEAVGTNVQAQQRTLTALSNTGTGGEYLFSETDPVFTQDWYRRLAKKALSAKRKADKTADTEERKQAIKEAIVRAITALRLQNEADPDFIKTLDESGWQENFSKGFLAAVNQEAQSNLPPEDGIAAGFRSGIGWMQGDEGKKFFKKRRVKAEEKVEGKGVRLKRMVDIMREARQASDMDAGIDQILSEAKASRHFKPDVGTEATPGAQELLKVMQRQIKPFAQWFVEEFEIPGRWRYKSREAIARWVRDENTGEDFNRENLKKLADEAEDWSNRAEVFADSVGRKTINPLIGSPEDAEIGIVLVDNVQAAAFAAFIEGGKDETDKNQYWRNYNLTTVGESVNKIMRNDIRRVIQDRIVNQYRRNEHTVPEKNKRIPRRPPMEFIDRQGVPDHRKGENAEADDYDQFKFVGVQVGNWTGKAQLRLREHMNFTHDSLLDLAAILGIKPADVSFGGTMLMSLGALGTGFADSKASAWFMPSHPDQGIPVINIINRRGDGSLAHEWHHGLDFLIKGDAARDAINSMKVTLQNRVSKSPGEYLEMLINWHWGKIEVDDITKKVRFANPALREAMDPQGDEAKRLTQLEDAIQDTLKALRDDPVTFFQSHWVADKTKFLDAAVRLDGFNEGKYWSKPEELFARASEAYVGDKLRDADQRNTYLVNDNFSGEGQAPPGLYKAAPFPESEERQIFNRMFDDLYAAIEWTEDGPVIKEPPKFRTQEEIIQEWVEFFEDPSAAQLIEGRIKEAREEADRVIQEKEEEAQRRVEEKRKKWEVGTEDEVAGADLEIDPNDKDLSALTDNDLDALFDEEEQLIASEQEGVERDAEGELTPGQQREPADSETARGQTEGRRDTPAGAATGTPEPGPGPGEAGAAGRTRSPVSGAGTDGPEGGDAVPGPESRARRGGADRARTEAEERSASGKRPGGRGVHGRSRKNRRVPPAVEQELAESGVDLSPELEEALGELLEVDVGTDSFGNSPLSSVAPAAFSQDIYDELKPKLVRTLRNLVLEQNMTGPEALRNLHRIGIKAGRDWRLYLKRILQDKNAGNLPELEEVFERDQDITGTKNARKRRSPGQRGPVAPPKVTKIDGLGENIFEHWKPDRSVTATFPQAKPHPATLDESATMRSAELPTNEYVISDLTQNERFVRKEGTEDKYRKIAGKFDPVETGDLSVAQLEAIKFTGRAHEKTLPDKTRRGFFIGDGTGVGKGREIAGVFIDNERKGRDTAVWVSDNSRLLIDARRDYAGAGGNPDRVSLFKKAINKGGVTFTTYAKLRHGKAGIFPNVKALIDQLGADFDGVIAFDEVHKLGGQSDIERSKDSSLTAQMAKILHDSLPNARFLYVSATGATDLSSIKYAERLGLWGPGTPWEGGADQFVAQMKQRGLGALEMIARNLKEMGLYISRALSWSDGTEAGTVQRDIVTHTVTGEQAEQYDRFTTLWADIKQSLDRQIVRTRLEGLGPVGKKEIAIIKSVYGGFIQRFFNQAITALKTETAIEHIKQVTGWNDETKTFNPHGDSALVQLVQTDEAVLNRAYARVGEALGDDDFSISPLEIVRDFLLKWFPTTSYRIETVKNPRTGEFSPRAVPDENAPIAELIAVRDAFIARLDELEAPESPIDALLREFGDQNVAEITGRKIRVIEGKPVSRSETEINQQATEFMDDNKRILVFSEKGGTGASYHADLSRQNQRMRHHYLLQPGWRASQAVQGLGRSHRSAQKQAPIIHLMESNISSEKRFISAIASRLDQLGAITRGQRETGSQGIFTAAHNIIGPFTMGSLIQAYNDFLYNGVNFVTEDGAQSWKLSRFEDRSGLKIQTDRGFEVRAKPPSLKQFLNGLLRLPIEVQNGAFDIFFKHLQEAINAAREAGTLDAGLENVVADSIIKETDVQVHDEEGQKTRYVRIKMRWQKPAMTFGEFRETMLSGEQSEYEEIRFGINKVNNGMPGRAWAFAFVKMPDGRWFSYTPWPHQISAKRIDNHRKVSLGFGAEGDIMRKHDMIDTSKDFKQAMKAWNDQVTRWQEDEEGAFTASKHLIAGAILPIWDRLVIGDKVPTQRAQIDPIPGQDPEVIIGMPIVQRNLEETLKRLGANATVRSPKELIEAILAGAKVILSNGDTIEVLTFTPEEAEERTEIVTTVGDITPYQDFKLEVRSGTERDLILPKKGTQRALRRIVERFPVADVIVPEAEQSELDVTAKTEAGKADLKATLIDREQLPSNIERDYTSEGFDDKKFFQITGRTFEHRRKVKQIEGAKWWADAKAWVIPASRQRFLEEAFRDDLDVQMRVQGKSGEGMEPELLIKGVKELREEFRFLPSVVVLNSQQAQSMPTKAARALKAGVPVDGYYDPQSGAVYLISDHITSIEHAMAVIAHEIFGHHGLRALARDSQKFRNLLRQIWNSAKNTDGMAQTIEDYPLFDANDQEDQLKLADEWFATLAERHRQLDLMEPMERTIVQRVIDAIRQLFLGTRIGAYLIKLNDREMLDLLRKSRQAASESYNDNYSTPSVDERAEIMFSLNRPRLMYGVDSAGNVKAAGVPNRDGSYDVYWASGVSILDTEPRKEHFNTKSDAKRKMEGRGYTIQFRGERYGPRPNTAEIHVNYTIPDETRWDRLVKTVQDRYRRLWIVQESFKNQGAELDVESDTYRAEERFHGLAFERIRKFEEKWVDPLIDRIAQARKELGITVDDVNAYLYAKHAEERNARMQEINPNLADNEALSGMSNETAEGILNRAKENGIDGVMEEIAGMVYRMHRARLVVLEKEGLASTESVTAMRETYEFYVPLRGKSPELQAIDGDEGIGLSTGRGLSAVGREKHAFGRKSLADDTLAYSIAMVEETIIKAEKNRVGKTFLRFIQRHPNRDHWTVNERQRKPRFNKETGEVEYYAAGYRPDVMVVWVDGKENHILIKDPLLRKAMLGLNVVQVNRIVQGIAKVTRFLAAVNTSLNPEFMLGNFPRDVQTALVNLMDENILKQHGMATKEGREARVKSIGLKVLKDLPNALRGAFFGLRQGQKRLFGREITAKFAEQKETKRWIKWFNEFRGAGGKIEFFSLQDIETKREDLRKKVERLAKGKQPTLQFFLGLRDMISDLNGAVENGIRLSTYANLRQQGISKEISASVARNLTVNFNRKGEIGNFMNALYMFFNAGIQGTARMFIAASSSKRVRRLMLAIMAGSFFLAEMMRWIGGEDEEDGQNHYDKVPDWVKEHNLIIMKPDGSGGYYKIPLPYGYNVLNAFGIALNDAAHAGLEGRLEKDLGHLGWRTVRAIINAFNPLGGDAGLLQMASPTVMDPFVQIASNENFYGAPIKPTQPTYLKYDMPQSELHWSSVRPLTRDATRWLNKATGGSRFRAGWADVSPEDVDHITDFFLGGAGAFVFRGYNWIYAMANNEPIKVREVPLQRRFVADAPEFVTPGQYRENIGEVIQVIESLADARQQGERETASEIMREERNVIQLKPFMRSTEAQLRRLRKQRRVIQESRLNEQLKKKRLESINERIQTLQKKFNRRFDEARKAG